MTISHLIAVRMRNISDRNFREDQNIHFVFNNFLYKDRAVFYIMWKTVVMSDRPQRKTPGMHFSC